jgi:hypothetical protein
MVITFISCSNHYTTQNTDIKEPEGEKSVSVFVERDLDEIQKQTLDFFADKVASLSEGKLLLRITQAQDPISMLDLGGDMAVLSTAALSKGDANFRIFESPFMFPDYKHLTLILNNEDFLKTVNETTGSLLQANVIAALYCGNSALLTIRDLSLDVLEQYEGLKISINDYDYGELTGYCFEKMGAAVTKADQDDRLNGFIDGKYHTIEYDTLQLTNIKMPTKREAINICETFHAPRIVWIMLSNECELSEYEAAILSESFSYLIAYHDEQILEEESRGFEHIAGLNSTLYSPDHDSFLEKVKNILESSARYFNLWDWKLYTQVQTMLSQ